MRIPGDVIRLISSYVLSPLDLVRLSRCNEYFHQCLNDSSEIKKWRSYSLEKRMRKAAKKGEEEIVKLCILKGANNWTMGLYGASRGGHRSMIDFFITKGATDLDGALSEASRGEHQLLIDFFQEKIKQRDE